jgi:hypothetical protein
MLEFSSTESCTTSTTSSPLVGFSSNTSSCDGNVALMNDFESTEGCSGQGPQGPQGFSAYQIAVFDGFVGTEEEWLASLVGPVGPGVPVGGTAGQILAKINSTNYNTQWINSPSLTGYVPYIGATQDLNLGEFGTQLGNIEFDTTPTSVPTGAGSLVWNDSDGTLDLKLKGGNVTLQIGQETVLRVVNKTATNINLLEANYQAVRTTGAQGQRLKVDLAQATNDALSAETIGLVTETINNNQEGFITTSGLVRGINTTGSLQGETWVDGDILYLSSTIAGNATKVKPVAPNHLIVLGYVINAHITQGSIFVKVDNGYELDELHNVKITTPVNNNVLAYTSASSIWENKTINTVIGYTPFNLPALTTGSVLFSNGTTIAENNANFFWDNANNRLGIGTTTPTAKLQVKGDGTNPIARFETSTSAISQQFYDTSMIGFGNVNPVYAGIYGHSSIDPNTATTSSLGVGLISNQSSSTASYGFGIRTTNGSNAAQWITGTGGLIKFITSGFIPSAAGSGNYRNLEINYSLNGTNGAQTGTATGIFLNATETALNGMVHNLMDLQRGGVSKFLVDRLGAVSSQSTIIGASVAAGTGGFYSNATGSKINSTVNGNWTFTNLAGTDFGLLQLGGTTSSYPAIKRNGAGIDFRLADDSGFCNIRTAAISATSIYNNVGAYYMDTFGFVKNANTNTRLNIFNNGYSIELGASNVVAASAIFELKSTTQGFLPPRMTTAQKVGIATPATGLVVFDTDLGKLCVFAVTWQTITSV